MSVLGVRDRDPRHAKRAQGAPLIAFGGGVKQQKIEPFTPKHAKCHNKFVINNRLSSLYDKRVCYIILS